MPVITFKQFGKMLHELPEDLNRAADRGMLIAGKKSVPEVQKQLRAASTSEGAYPLDYRGNMIRSVVSRGSFKSRGKRRRTVVDIVVDVPYAQAMEFGTAPFTPPLAPLIAWAETKVASFKSSRIAGKGRGSKIANQQKGSKAKGGKFRNKSSRSGNKAAQRMAFLIQQKFSKEGIKPRFYMSKSMPKINANVGKELRRSMKRLAKEYPIRVTVRRIR